MSQSGLWAGSSLTVVCPVGVVYKGGGGSIVCFKHPCIEITRHSKPTKRHKWELIRVTLTEYITVYSMLKDHPHSLASYSLSSALRLTFWLEQNYKTLTWCKHPVLKMCTLATCAVHFSLFLPSLPTHWSISDHHLEKDGKKWAIVCKGSLSAPSFPQGSLHPSLGPVGFGCSVSLMAKAAPVAVVFD